MPKSFRRTVSAKRPAQPQQGAPPIEAFGPGRVRSLAVLAVAACAVGGGILAVGAVLGARQAARVQAEPPIAVKEEAIEPFVPLETAEPMAFAAALHGGGALAPAEHVMQRPPRQIAVTVRRDLRSEADLRAELRRIPEVGLDQSLSIFTRDPMGKTAERLWRAAKSSPGKGTVHVLPDLLGERADLGALPLCFGKDCETEPAVVQEMLELAPQLHKHVIKGKTAGPGERRDTAQFLRWDQQAMGSAAAVPCLMQVLQVEDDAIRQFLVEQLARLHGARSTEALARLAIYDTSAAVRSAAVRALGERRASGYRPILLAGFRHPWPPVADHAAEALVALGDRGAIPALSDLAREANPAAPFSAATSPGSFIPPSGGLMVGDAAATRLYARELVQINHMQNCMLCHPPSRPAEPGGSAVPQFNLKSAKPDAPTGYETTTVGPAVRPGITYLRQDFSITQPVEHAGAWPEDIRFDYVVRTRLVTKQEAEAARRMASSTWPQREAILFALQHLNESEKGR